MPPLKRGEPLNVYLNGEVRPMSGYEKSPDYGGPDPNWREWATLILVAAVGAGFLIWLYR